MRNLTFSHHPPTLQTGFLAVSDKYVTFSSIDILGDPDVAPQPMVDTTPRLLALCASAGAVQITMKFSTVFVAVCVSSTGAFNPVSKPLTRVSD
jgi:hypothetical protein